MDSSKSNNKNDSLIKNLDHATKKVLSKSNYKTHYRHSSMEVKFDPSKYTKSPNSKNLTKNIHAMKEMLLNNGKNSGKILSKGSTGPSNRHTGASGTASNIILNQGGNPCFNQITIYTTNSGNSNNVKPNDINLRQYIYNKMNKPKSMININGNGNNHMSHNVSSNTTNRRGENSTNTAAMSRHGSSSMR